MAGLDDCLVRRNLVLGSNLVICANNWKEADL